jgi:DNA helicase-2/ATP-dependent DNA helicase PcrA
MMQRIFADGKADLGLNIPSDWSKPQKTVNFRCPKKVIRLINQIRQASDGWEQVAREAAPEGYARMFIVRTPAINKQLTEQNIRERMAAITGDKNWVEPDRNKTLILEHHMAAKRMGFLDMYEPLAKVDEFATGLRDGSIGLLRFFSDQVFAVVNAHRKNDAFAVGRIVRKYSPLLTADEFRKATRQQDQIVAAKVAVDRLSELCDPENSPIFRQVLELIAKSNLFEVPETLYPYVDGSSSEIDVNEEDLGNRVLGIREFLETPFQQIKAYTEYTSGLAQFGTHQGVKGLEFPRVMVLMDDEEARGFMFSYDKLFGGKALSNTDVENQRSGKETSIDRTRRLLYVTCSRAEESLALVAYTSNVEELRSRLMKLGWFQEDEIEQIDG